LESSEAAIDQDGSEAPQSRNAGPLSVLVLAGLVGGGVGGLAFTVAAVIANPSGYQYLAGQLIYLAVAAFGCILIGVFVGGLSGAAVGLLGRWSARAGHSPTASIGMQSIAGALVIAGIYALFSLLRLAPHLLVAISLIPLGISFAFAIGASLIRRH
jgi:hypothetical protein